MSGLSETILLIFQPDVRAVRGGDHLADSGTRTDFRVRVGMVVSLLVTPRIRSDWRLAERLVPKIPFGLAGAFVSANLYVVDAVKVMRFYGDLASQLHDLPDRAQVELKVIS